MFKLHHTDVRLYTRAKKIYLNSLNLSHVHHLNHFVTCSRYVPLGLLIPLMWMDGKWHGAR